MKSCLDQLTARKSLRVAGLMSGTSADGISVAIVDLSLQGRGDEVRLKVKLVAFDTFSYSATIRRQIFELFQPATSHVDNICHLNFVLGELFAEAVLRLARQRRIPLGTIDLVGSHGQTIYHIPQGRRALGRRVRSTLQIGEPSVIAERTGLTTVADFRPRDVAAGGEGAPLVPYTDHLLFHDSRRTRAVQNIGGIANVTYLPAGGGSGDILAFDTGPGNMIMDRLAWHITGGRQSYDRGGRLAARGQVNEKLLAELLRHPFLRRRPPKSTGREEFGAQFADDLWARTGKTALAPHDLLATATAFTARSMAEAYRRFLPRPVDEVILCGGGSWNRTLVAMIERETGAAVRMMDEFGISVDAKEAVSFAILAYATIHGLPGNVPTATGASRRVVLGKVVPGTTMGVSS